MFTKNVAYKLSHEQREQRKLQTNSFPNQISLGSFTPHSTLVEVSCFRTNMVSEAFKKGDLMPIRKDIQVLCHEMAHWFDFFGTIWGRNYIGDICRAYRGFERRVESEFPNIIKLFDQDRSVLSPDYYRYSKAPSVPHSKDRPWSIEYVTGTEIDVDGNTREDRPIFMAKYGENPSRKNFARQPISVGALLEVRAIAAEMGAAISAINSHAEKGARIVEMSEAGREFNDIAYGHELIEYNTAAHILSQQSGSMELFLSCRLASALAFIALNMTKVDFDSLKIPDAFNNFGDRNKAFIKRQDRGYAFVCMVFNGGKFDGDEAKYVEGCVAKSNLGSAANILERAIGVLQYPIRLANGNETINHFVRESAMSKRILEVHIKCPNYTTTLETIISKLSTICPPFMDADVEFVELNIGSIAGYKPKEMHDASQALHDYTRNLLIGCRGV
jgi:hypothetical protein